MDLNIWAERKAYCYVVGLSWAGPCRAHLRLWADFAWLHEEFVKWSSEPCFLQSRSHCSAMADRSGRSKEGFVTYGYILIYIVLSSGQIFFNKVCFSFLCVSIIDSVLGFSHFHLNLIGSGFSMNGELILVDVQLRVCLDWGE